MSQVVSDFPKMIYRGNAPLPIFTYSPLQAERESAKIFGELLAAKVFGERAGVCITNPHALPECYMHGILGELTAQRYFEHFKIKISQPVDWEIYDAGEYPSWIDLKALLPAGECSISVKTGKDDGPGAYSWIFEEYRRIDGCLKDIEAIKSMSDLSYLFMGVVRTNYKEDTDYRLHAVVPFKHLLLRDPMDGERKGDKKAVYLSDMFDKSVML